MTNKTILEVLKLASFKNPNAIAAIIGYVPNADVALEMLLGIHEPLVVDDTNRFRLYRNSNYSSLVELIGYDELANKILYKKYTQKTEQTYYLSEQDYLNHVNGTNIRPSKHYDYRYESIAGYTESDESDAIEGFGFTKPISNEDAFEMLTHWENFGVFIEKDPTDSNDYAMAA